MTIGLFILSYLLAFPAAVSGLLTVYSYESEGAPSSVTSAEQLDTATLRYYGRQSASVEGQGVFIGGKFLCNVRESGVAGKIVYSDRIESPCDIGDVYDQLDRAKALALVVITSEPLGIFTFRHNGFDKRAYRDRDLIYVDVRSQDAELERWKKEVGALRYAS